MTSVEVQALLTTINGHIDGKAGVIYQVAIDSDGAQVTIDWEAFIANFAGDSTNITRSDSTKNPVWTKTIGNIKYEAKQPIDNPPAQTVPLTI